MAARQINPNRVYHNFHGRLPPVALDSEMAQVPPDSAQTQPKFITDTTLRDGAQDPRFPLFPVDLRLRYFDLLHRLDHGTGVIENLEVFIYQKRDLWALDRLLERGYDFPQVTTWTRANPRDIKLLSEVSGGRIKETGMLASSSDHHIFDKLHFHSKEEAAEKYLQPIMTACELGIRPRIHLEDTTKADIFGFVIPFMQRVLEETGGTAKFRVCDTIGDGVPDPHAALPFGVPKLISTLIRETGAELEFHGHNDFGLATANSIAAWIYGCKRVNCAAGGLGERTGNTSLEQMVAAYVRLYGDPGFDLTALTEIGDLVSDNLVPVPVNQPLIGRDVFTTQAGIHQAGVSRQADAEGGLIYLAYDPRNVGRTAVEWSRVGAVAGAEGVVALLNQAWERKHGQPDHFNVNQRVIKYVYDHVQAAYDGDLDSPEAPKGERREFFSADELLALAEEFERRPR